MRTTAAQITIRLAEVADDPALRALAQLDSSSALAAPILVAESDGEPRAALSLGEGRAVADPFVPTEHLLALLRVHATRLRVEAEPATGNGWRRWVPRAPAPSPVRAS
jgi:hypothetical protein